MAQESGRGYPAMGQALERQIGAGSQPYRSHKTLSYSETGFLYSEAGFRLGLHIVFVFVMLKIAGFMPWLTTREGADMGIIFTLMMIGGAILYIYPVGLASGSSERYWDHRFKVIFSRTKNDAEGVTGEPLEIGPRRAGPAVAMTGLLLIAIGLWGIIVLNDLAAWALDFPGGIALWLPYLIIVILFLQQMVVASNKLLFYQNALVRKNIFGEQTFFYHDMVSLELEHSGPVLSAERIYYYQIINLKGKIIKLRVQHYRNLYGLENAFRTTNSSIAEIIKENNFPDNLRDYK